MGGAEIIPYYNHNGITIYHGDCREILPTLGPIDLVLTDPPYGINYVTAWRLRGDPLRVPVANDCSLNVFADAWQAIYGALRDGSHWYVFASPLRISEVEAITGKPKHILAWDKGNGGTVGDLTCGFGESWEAIFYGMKGRRPLNGKRPRTVIRKDWNPTRDPVHPTVKPVSLLSQIISWSSDVGEIILDPFMGSGTTLRAAKDLNRRAIGIEIEEKYCEIATRRLEQEVLAL